MSVFTIMTNVFFSILLIGIAVGVMLLIWAMVGVFMERHKEDEE